MLFLVLQTTQGAAAVKLKLQRGNPSMAVGLFETEAKPKLSR